VKPGEIVELKFDLLPIFYEFKKGHRIRLTLTCADKDNTNSHKIFAESEITVYQNAKYPSNIELPLLKTNE
jgi:predicted acyl esterase